MQCLTRVGVPLLRLPPHRRVPRGNRKKVRAFPGGRSRHMSMRMQVAQDILPPPFLHGASGRHMSTRMQVVQGSLSLPEAPIARVDLRDPQRQRTTIKSGRPKGPGHTHRGIHPIRILPILHSHLDLHHRLVGIRRDLHHLRGIPHILHSPVDLHHLNAGLLEERENSLCGGRGNLSGDGPFALSIESMYSSLRYPGPVYT